MLAEVSDEFGESPCGETEEKHILLETVVIRTIRGDRMNVERLRCFVVHGAMTEECIDLNGTQLNLSHLAKRLCVVLFLSDQRIHLSQGSSTYLRTRHVSYRRLLRNPPQTLSSFDGI